VAARAYSSLMDAPAETRRAAKAYLDRFLDEERAARILDVAGGGDGVPRSALALLDLGGIAALDRVLETLGHDPAPDVTIALRDFVARRGVEDLTRVLRWRIERGWTALRPVFPILEEMAPIDSIPLLESLLEHDEYEIRRQALLLLEKQNDGSGGYEKHLRRGLESSDRDYVDLVLQCLSRLSSGRATDLLGGLVDGRYGAGVPTDLRVRAARLLGLRGEAGVRRLCLALDDVARGLRPQRVRLARWIRALLDEYRDLEPVARCIERWRHSPAGVVSWFLPRPRVPRIGELA